MYIQFSFSRKIATHFHFHWWKSALCFKHSSLMMIGKLSNSSFPYSSASNNDLTTEEYFNSTKPEPELDLTNDQPNDRVITRAPNHHRTAGKNTKKVQYLEEFPFSRKKTLILAFVAKNNDYFSKRYFLRLTEQKML